MSEQGNQPSVKAERSKKPNVRYNYKRMTIAAVIVIVVLIILGVWIHHVVSPSVFPSGSKINGISVENLTAEQAEKKVVSKWQGKSLKVMYKGQQVAVFNHSEYTYNISKEVENALHPGFSKAMSRAFNKSKRQVKIAMNPDMSNSNFEQTFNNMSIVKNDQYTTKTKNAYVSMKNRKFKIVKEVYGDNLDKAKLKKAIANAIAEGKSTFTYNKKDYYAKPKYTSKSKKVLNRQAFCKKHLGVKITYKGLNTSYTLTPKEIESMLKFSGDNKTVKASAVKSFVKNTLSSKLSTVGAERKLKSAGGGTYTVAGGNYGYNISKSKMEKLITSDLKKDKDVSHEAVYTKNISASKLKSGSDIGNSYVEVNISTQTVYCVIKGKKVLTTSVVTGNVAENHATPYGVFILNYKAKDVNLKGQNADGSDYSSHVSYWMPFNGGIGLHDATWRSSFGGSIYKTNGSHGCVNMPPSAAATLYSYVHAGMPVIVHA
ncbi:MAG: L,D-transpeptidase family protein [Eubacterium sp.]